MTAKTKMIGKYEMGKTLGEGQFGKVKFAINTENRQRVAIKKMSKAKVIKSGMLEKVKREIAIMKRIHHPHVVNLHEVLVSEEYLYMVLEFVAGGELFHVLARERRFSEEKARLFFQQLISGLKYVHSQGICHRDLKPENLLIDDKGALKISDFGLSALHEESSDQLCHTKCGTQNYVAPEVLGEDYAGYDGFKADIWSCGVILYVFLAGRMPFDEPTPDELYRKIRAASFAYPSHFSPSVKNLLSGILVPDPDVRLTIAQIEAHEWFQQDNCCIAPGLLTVEKPTEVEESWKKVSDQPQTSGPILIGGVPITNAFELIAMSGALDLTPLLAGSRETMTHSHTRFPTRAEPDVIINKIKGLSKRQPWSVKVASSRLEITAFSPRGTCRFEIQVLYLARDLRMVAFQRKSGDMFEFYKYFDEISSGCADLREDVPQSAQHSPTFLSTSSSSLPSISSSSSTLPIPIAPSSPPFGSPPLSSPLSSPPLFSLATRIFGSSSPPATPVRQTSRSSKESIVYE